MAETIRLGQEPLPVHPIASEGAEIGEVEQLTQVDGSDHRVEIIVGIDRDVTEQTFESMDRIVDQSMGVTGEPSVPGGVRDRDR